MRNILEIGNSIPKARVAQATLVVFGCVLWQTVDCGSGRREAAFPGCCGRKSSGACRTTNVRRPLYRHCRSCADHHRLTIPPPQTRHETVTGTRRDGSGHRRQPATGKPVLSQPRRRRATQTTKLR